MDEAFEIELLQLVNVNFVVKELKEYCKLCTELNKTLSGACSQCKIKKLLYYFEDPGNLSLFDRKFVR